jgi:hypothetical protein
MQMAGCKDEQQESSPKHVTSRCWSNDLYAQNFNRERSETNRLLRNHDPIRPIFSFAECHNITNAPKELVQDTIVNELDLVDQSGSHQSKSDSD